VTVVATGLRDMAAQRQTMSVVQGGLRTGTDNVSFTTQAPLGAAPQVGGIAGMTDYGNTNVPSVWRNNRTTAASKVDALSSAGVDDFEIPAFLRKQAD
jgi:cell division protein FtsZ